MGFVCQSLCSIATALAEIDGDGERRSTRRNVHGGTAGEVEAAHDEGPAVGVPGPVGDWVVDDGGPDEDEDEEGNEDGNEDINEDKDEDEKEDGDGDENEDEDEDEDEDGDENRNEDRMNR